MAKEDEKKQSNEAVEPLTREEILKLFPEEIKVVQDIIKRMAANSFQLKGWSVTLVAATLALKVAVENPTLLWVIFIPILMFWGLDTYYLREERKFREVHKWLAENRLKENSIQQRAIYNVNPIEFEDKVDSFISVATSSSIAWFYLPITAIVLAFLYLLQSKV